MGVMIAQKAAVVLATLCALAAARADTAENVDEGQLNSITVQGQTDREAVKRQASAFVSAVAVQPWEQSLARWSRPICPLVAGLTRDQGEFILARLSQIVASAGAPLAAENCQPNFYVVATKDPDALLSAWRRRDKGLFGGEPGPKIRRFLSTPAPVRVWYNADLDSVDGVPLTGGGLALYAGGPSGTGTGFNGLPTNLHAKLSHLQWDELRSLASVIVIVDMRRAIGVNFGQLADYIALAGLTEVRLGADVGGAVSILNLFRGPVAAAPPALSPWDQAFLAALYHTDQSDKLQESVIATRMARTFSP
jgi:hypothetical protein